jgi:transcription-repair coupling factor (superfamily II helicase)
VRELKGEDLEDDLRATVNLRIDFRIDDRYVPDMNQRLMIYRRIAAARRDDELTRIMEEMRDRYGPPPVPVLNLADYGRIRVMADELGIDTVDREVTVVVLKFRAKAKVDPMRVITLVGERGDLKLIPPSTLKMDLREPTTPKAGPAPESVGRSSSGGRGVGPVRPVKPSRAPRERREPAWWTARATAGEVTPGFSKAEIMRPKAEDPRAPGGILERVEGLLDDLRD